MSGTPSMNVTDRYRIYARAHGRTPARMLAHDRKQWPGGCMAGFILWCRMMWRRWEGETGETEPWRRHDAFDAWLELVA